jgi:hypothetical protein
MSADQIEHFAKVMATVNGWQTFFSSSPLQIDHQVQIDALLFLMGSHGCGKGPEFRRSLAERIHHIAEHIATHDCEQDQTGQVH